MIDLGGDTTGNGISKLVFTILSAVAEAERDRTRERVAEVKRDQSQRGRFLGGTAPFGYRNGEAGDLVPVPEQQAAIRRMRRRARPRAPRCGRSPRRCGTTASNSHMSAWRMRWPPRTARHEQAHPRATARL